MESRKKRWIIDFFTILMMMATVILLCHPIGRNWTEEEIDRYVGTDGDYSPDVDTYYYLRKAKEFSRGGINSITLAVHRADDPMCTTGDAIAREANGTMPMLLPASAALTWYGLRLIGVDVSIYTVTIRFCSFLLSLFVIPVYLFLRKRTSWLAAVLGALLVALEMPFFRHSHAGFFDTDAMIGFWALVLVLSLFECFVAKKRKNQVFYGALSLVALAFLRFTWTAFFIYGVISAGTAMMGVVGVRLCGKFNREQRKSLMIPVAFWVAVVVSSLALGWNSFVSLAKGFVSASAKAGDWPSETMYITELNKVSISDGDSLWYHFVVVGRDITSVTGGIIALLLLLVLVIICVVELIRFIRCRSEKTDEVFLLSASLTWLAGTTILAFFGARYMEFFTLPSAIIIGLKFDCIKKFCEKRTISGRRVLYVLVGFLLFGAMVLKFPIAAVITSATVFAAGWYISTREKASVLAVFFAVAVLLPIGISCYAICAQEEPYVERPIEEAMIWVRENTASDSVLADFWNLGYIYQYYGERRTIADGGTYNGQFFYWLAVMEVTENHQLSAGIARMLQNCGIDGSEYAQDLTGDANGARALLIDILPLTRADAETKLQEAYGFSGEQIKRLLNYTHPEECPDIYFAVSHNTFNLVSSFLIYWNWGDESKKSPEGGTYYSKEAILHPQEGEIKYLKLSLGADDSVGVQVALEAHGDELAGAVVTNKGSFNCGREIYFKDGDIIFDRKAEGFDGSTQEEEMLFEEALLLVEEKGMVSAVLLDKAAVDSVFINLFLKNGMNQSVFEKVYDSEDGEGVQARIFDNSSISIWKLKTER